jgi:hypothetical protein
MVTSTEQPNLEEVYGPWPEYVPQVAYICGLSGPPLFPHSYADAKRWSKGKMRLKLGRYHTLERVPSGFVVRDKGQTVAGWLAPPDELIDRKEKGRPRLRPHPTTA